MSGDKPTLTVRCATCGQKLAAVDWVGAADARGRLLRVFPMRSAYGPLPEDMLEFMRSYRDRDGWAEVVFDNRDGVDLDLPEGPDEKYRVECHRDGYLWMSRATVLGALASHRKTLRVTPTWEV